MTETIDLDHVHRLLQDDQLGSKADWRVENVTFALPRSEVRQTKDQKMNWQRRVLEDVIPESPNSDAPYKIPFKILRGLTSPERPDFELKDALSGSFAPLVPLFTRTTQGKALVPAAFHVLAARAPKSEISSRSFSEKTFGLLCRDSDGFLNEPLLDRFLERFRQKPQSLDLAQQTVLEKLKKGWSPEQGPSILLDSIRLRVKPLFMQPNVLLQADLKTLLEAELSPADFLEFFNQLLSLHFGLFQPRLACLLNPLMNMLFHELGHPGSVSVEEAQRIEQGTHPVHRFEYSLLTRVPSPRDQRPVRKDSPEVLSFDQLAEALTHLHFNLMLLHRVRELAEAFLRSQDYDPKSCFELVQRPSQIIERLQRDDDFRRFMLRASEVLAVRFLRNQIIASHEERMKSELERVEAGRTGFDALRSLYHSYNRQSGAKSASSRAYKQGIQVTRSLLYKGEYGLIQARPRVGAYCELGSGLLPLLLLLIIGPKRDRIRVDQFWEGLGRYGLQLPPTEQENLLQRLKSMGLYERFSDAGEANYILNLITMSAEG